MGGAGRRITCYSIRIDTIHLKSSFVGNQRKAPVTWLFFQNDGLKRYRIEVKLEFSVLNKQKSFAQCYQCFLSK